MLHTKAKVFSKTALKLLSALKLFHSGDPAGKEHTTLQSD